MHPLRIILLSFLFSTSAFACYESSIVSPTPFMGNNDEVFKLSDGSIWQVKYEYEYLYEYYPDVVICPSNNVLIIDSKKLNVVNLSNSGSSTPSSELIESRIDGTFNGWDGDTIVKLVNGQIWQQSRYHYSYHYAYRPEVLIYKQSFGFMMQVGDMDPVRVNPLK